VGLAHGYVLRIAEGVTKCLLDIKTIGFMA